MKTEASYYLILFVYISLWSCQLIACHLTHSIMDISVGIIHLRTQRQLARQTDTQRQQLEWSKKSTMAGKLFHCICTYKYKRLPLLGAFVNGLFLAALLMSAAIEGIQTCFHSGHSGGGHDATSILVQNELTYPSILVGFALVGLIMQYCSSKAHEMREDELGSESLLDISGKPRATTTNDKIQTKATIKELSASNLNDLDHNHRPLPDELNNHNKRATYDLNHTKKKKTHKSSSESIHSAKNNKLTSSQISLKSLKFTTNLEILPANSSTGVNGNQCTDIEASRVRQTAQHDNRWFYVRYFASPVVLTLDALIVYGIKDELVVEVADAGLAVIIVILLFAASYPPMKRAGKVLLQTAPDGVDLDRLLGELRRVGPQVSDVQDLKVWSLTPTSNRVATCRLILDRDLIESERQVTDILREAKFKFLEQNIKCSTIEPVLRSNEKQDTNQADHNHHHHHQATD